ncbi:MAG TPA: hypothetical protein VF892_14920, partial [Pseudonocardiaceae bacterium]
MADSVSARRTREPVVISGLAVRCAAGAGPAALARACAGSPAFEAVSRFDTSGRRTRVAATLPGTPVLMAELAAVIEEA